MMEKLLILSLSSSHSEHTLNAVCDRKVYVCTKALKPFLTCILHFHPGPSLFVVWQTRKKTATESDNPLTLCIICNIVCLVRYKAATEDANKCTCCAVSILSFSMESIWKPLSRTSSVDAGTVAVKGDCNDRDERLHKSSMGNCTGKKRLLVSQHTRNSEHNANPVIGCDTNLTACLVITSAIISLFKIAKI